MPLYDFRCLNTECSEYYKIKESVVFSTTVLPCDKCVVPMEKIIEYKCTFQLKGRWPGKDIKGDAT